MLDALHARRPGLEAVLFTRLAPAFLASSLAAPHRVVECDVDVGMVQRGPFRADLEATARAVTAFLDGLEAAAAGAAARIREAGCAAVLCDVSPLGIAAAALAGVPSVLLENFRWDWIYGTLAGAPAALREAGARMADLYRAADLHLQVPPVCDAAPGAVRLAAPIARGARRSRADARRALGVAGSDRVVLVTTGGVTGTQPFLEALAGRPDLRFVVTGAERTGRDGHVHRIAADRPLYLPDAIRASDAVVAKLGYSTLAEVWREGRPLLRVPRAQWPEGPVLSAWADTHVPGFEMDERDFAGGAWVDALDRLLALPAAAPAAAPGQEEAAERILERLG